MQIKLARRESLRHLAGVSYFNLIPLGVSNITEGCNNILPHFVCCQIFSSSCVGRGVRTKRLSRVSEESLASFNSSHSSNTTVRRALEGSRLLSRYRIRMSNILWKKLARRVTIGALRWPVGGITFG